MLDTRDWITLIGLGLGLCLAGLLYVRLRRGTIRIEALPVVLGNGAGVYSLMWSLVAGVLLLPQSGIAEWMVFCLLLSIGVGAVSYFAGRRIAERARRED